MNRFIFALSLLVVAVIGVRAQSPKNDATPEKSGNGISLAPARLELEMQPGQETTVVVNLDYHTTSENSQPVRIVASLNDWTIDRDGQVQFESKHVAQLGELVADLQPRGNNCHTRKSARDQSHGFSTERRHSRRSSDGADHRATSG